MSSLNEAFKSGAKVNWVQKHDSDILMTYTPNPPLTPPTPPPLPVPMQNAAVNLRVVSLTSTGGALPLDANGSIICPSALTAPLLHPDIHPSTQAATSPQSSAAGKVKVTRLSRGKPPPEPSREMCVKPLQRRVKQEGGRRKKKKKKLVQVHAKPPELCLQSRRVSRRQQAVQFRGRRLKAVDLRLTLAAPSKHGREDICENHMQEKRGGEVGGGG